MKNRKYDVTALGELLIDFTENGDSAQGNPLMEANPGGAPCNVLAMLQKLGKKTAFIGKVGNDMFGNQLKKAVEEVGIDTRNLIMDHKHHTTLAFVHTYPDGDRDFSFYRDPGADMMLTKEEVQKELIPVFFISVLFLPPMKVSEKRPVMPLNWQKRPAVSLLLIRISALLCGILWTMHAERSNTEWENAMY